MGEGHGNLLPVLRFVRRARGLSTRVHRFHPHPRHPFDRSGTSAITGRTSTVIDVRSRGRLSTHSSELQVPPLETKVNSCRICVSAATTVHADEKETFDSTGGASTRTSEATDHVREDRARRWETTLSIAIRHDHGWTLPCIPHLGRSECAWRDSSCRLGKKASNPRLCFPSDELVCPTSSSKNGSTRRSTAITSSSLVSPALSFPTPSQPWSVPSAFPFEPAFSSLSHAK